MMNEAQIRALIAQVVAELLDRQRAKRVMVLWSGAMLGCGPAAEALTRLSALGLSLDYVQTPSSKRLHSAERLAQIGMTEASGHFVLDHDLLVLPTMTVNLMSKVATGVADCLGSNVIADFIQTGKPVIASSTGVDPQGEAKRSIYPHMPPAYAEVLSANFRRLADFGVIWAEADRLDQAVLATSVGSPADCCGASEAAPADCCPALPDSPSSPVGPSVVGLVTCGLNLISHTVVAPLAAGTVLQIKPGAIVTAQAADAAYARSIKIVRKV
ncbi:MAG: hypothetical protein LBL55_11985 [Propionibacteriaceae bacterium]|jgi:hypothetical protein|nr:hypothetical protein [Propionibacteriaceae bacterium]